MSQLTMESTLSALLQAKKYSSVRDVLVTMNPADVAAVLEETDNEVLIKLFRLLPKELAAEAFAEMDPEIQQTLVNGFSDFELKGVLEELYVDDAVDLVEEMPASVVKRILEQANPELRSDINEILRYPENSAGSIMTTEYVTLTANMTVGDAIAHIRKTGSEQETIYASYVIENGLLIGFVTAKKLLFYPNDNALIGTIMDTNIITANVHDDKEQVAEELSKYNFVVLPVVDDSNHMLGIITFDDAMDVIRAEAAEDMEIMAAMTPSDKTYLHSSIFEIYKNRIPWLLLLMISATFTGMIINSFESALAAQVVLTAFIPMIMDTGGNSGSQSSVTIIRALSLGEVEFSDLARVIWKEIRVAVLCGFSLAAVCFIKVMLVDRLLLGNPDVTWLVAAIVCLTMGITVLIAKIIGCVLPLCAKRLGFDPAVMASPFITTIVDALALLVYFTAARAFLSL